jgi:predicted transcriptional regulator
MVDDLPTGVRDLIVRHLASMDHVTVLLFLWQAAPATQAPSAIAAALQLDHQTVSRALRDLTVGNLVRNESRTPDGPFVFAPASSRVNETVRELDDAYNRRPVTLIRALYARPPRPVQSFADAFRLHDDDKKDG